MKRLTFLSLLICVLNFVFYSNVFADGFPKKPLTIIVPYSSGGGSDIMVRTITQIIKDNKLSPKPIVVVNKTGGGGLVGKNFVWNKPADGYTVTLADIGNVVHPFIKESLQWGTGDWDYLSNMVFDVNLLCVKADTYKNLNELVSAIKNSEKLLTAGGTGPIGSPNSVSTIKLSRAIGRKINYVPMKGGGKVVTALMGGHISMGWFNPSEIISQINAGKIIAIAVASPERISSMPEIATFKELLGYDLVSIQQRGLAMKKGAPPEALQFWQDILMKVSQSEEWAEYLKNKILEDGWLAGVEFEKWMTDAKNDFRKTLKFLKETSN